jgi:hypothetical protein
MASGNAWHRVNRAKSSGTMRNVCGRPFALNIALVATYTSNAKPIATLPYASHEVLPAGLHFA